LSSNFTSTAVPAPQATQERIWILHLGPDRQWLAVMLATTAAEFVWWACAWMSGIAPAPLLFTYLALVFAVLTTAMILRIFLRPRGASVPWAAVTLGAILVAVGSSFFLPLKFAIPREIPFWLDAPLAEGERWLFGTDPWLLLDRAFGWAAVPIDRLYGVWVPAQLLVLFTVMLEPPSPAKSRALIAYSLAWFVLGVAAAVLFSSAGPLFYDRLFGGRELALLGETLRSRGAWIALAESDAMWAAMVSDRPGLVAGISAMPSLHVAISLWIYLAARSMAPRAAPIALAYFIFMWLASVQLGWHYVSDGLAGAIGMLAIWTAAAAIERVLGSDRSRVQMHKESM
jgi:hypothetical protein